jgi:glycosyltransferase involved in cell wall biosynthesis
MRIAFISETFLPKIDGITNTLCRVLEHLDRRGHESIMFAPQGAPDVYANTPILQPISIPFPFYPELKIANPFTNLERHLVKFRPDLIHVVNPFSIGVAGTRYACLNDIPLVASYHTDVPGYSNRFYGMPFMTHILWDYFRWIHNQADLTLCPSQATLQELDQQGFKNLRLWSRGVDLEKFAPSKCSPEWRWRLSNGRPESFILLYVGRLAAEKRVDWLLPVIQSMPFAHLVIVGDGPMREDLQLLFRGTDTTFTGYLQGEDLAHAYASSDIFVFPSPNETFGNVVLEAMASGLPVIAPRSGGVIDSIVNGENGFLFDCENKNDLLFSVSKIVANPTLLWKMGSQARQFASKCSWSGVLDHLIEDYSLAINLHHHKKALLTKSVHASYHKQPFWLE